MLIQCTKKLLDELKIKPELEVKEEPVFSWHANVVEDDNKKSVVLLNDKNNNIVVVDLIEEDLNNNINQRILNAIDINLKRYDYRLDNDKNFSEIIYSKTSSRSLVSKLNNICKHLNDKENENISKGKLELIFTYLKSLTNLYGIVSKSKVVEIFNLQNDDTINEKDLDNAIKLKSLNNEIFVYYENYFVEVSIIFGKTFNELLKLQENKPFYIPDKMELMKYEDQFYYEDSSEYKKLKDFIVQNFINDEEILGCLCADIRIICGGQNFSINAVLAELYRRNIKFKNKKQMYNFIPLVMELANNTRIWANRGFAPKETHGSIIGIGKSDLNSRKIKKYNKIGRNDPCLCGSGKKYKRCCLIKVN